MKLILACLHVIDQEKVFDEIELSKNLLHYLFQLSWQKENEEW
jgi:hypothetical protein